MAKRSQRLSVSYNTDDMLVTYKVLNAADEVLRMSSYNFTEVHDALQDKVSLYGLNKLLTDRTSDVKDKLEKLDKMTVTMLRLIGGEWAKERQVSFTQVSADVEALARLKELSIPQAQAALASYDKGTRARILARDDVQAIAAEIRTERAEAAAAPSLDDMI